MRVVVDTNIVVSATLWQGTPGKLITLALEGEIELFTSKALLDELSDVLHRRHLIAVEALSSRRVRTPIRALPAAYLLCSARR